MFFDKFIEQISLFTGNKIHQKNNNRIIPLLRPSKDESERLTLEEANRLIAKKKYKLNKLFAGVADKNLASKKVFEKNNFKLEGIRKKHLFINNKFYNQLDYGLLLK